MVGCKQKTGATTALIDDGDIHCLMIGAAGVEYGGKLNLVMIFADEIGIIPKIQSR